MERFEDLANLHGINELEKVLPGLLSAKTYSVYKNLNGDDKANYKSLKNALLSAFFLDRRLAYEKFASRKLLEGESVDVFVSDLKKLGRLVDAGLSDEFIKHAFLSGLPHSLKVNVKTSV